MPVARFEMPDGRIGRFEVPEGTTPEQAQQMITEHLSAQPKQDGRPELMSRMQNIAGGLVRGAGSIGATILAPYDMAQDAIKGDRGKNLSSLITGVERPSRNAERRQAMTDALQSMGLDPQSAAFQGGKIGGEVAGTLGAGPLLATGARLALPAQAVTKAAPVLSAIESAGMSAGGLTGAAGVGTRAAGGAVTGGAAAGLVDPEQAGLGAIIGGVLPGGIQLVGATAHQVGRVLRSSDTRTAQALAKALDITDPANMAEVAAKLNAAKALIPGSRPTVAQVLRSPQAGILERVVSDSPGGAHLKGRYATQNAARMAALEGVAPTNAAGFRQAQQDFGTTALKVTRDGDAAARAATSAQYNKVPQDQATLYMPDFEAVRDSMFSRGSIANREAVDDVVNRYRELGFTEIPAVKAVRATEGGQTLAQAVRKAGGVNLGGGLRGEAASLRGELKNLVRPNGGKNLNDLAEQMHEAGFIADDSVDTLLDALRAEARGKPVYSSGASNTDRAWQAARERAMGDAPGARRVPKQVTLKELADLRGDIKANARGMAGKPEMAKAKLTLEKMAQAIDDRIDEVVRGDGAIEENLPLAWADDLTKAQKMKREQAAKYRTGPQAEAFRMGSDGLPKVQGGEFAAKLWGSRPGIADDIKAFRNIMDEKPELMAQFRSMVTTQGLGTQTQAGNLTGKFAKWVEQSLPGLKASFTLQQVKVLQRIAADIKRAEAGASAGMSRGSNTYQNAANALDLGLLDNPVVKMAAGRIPGVGMATDWMRESARASQARRMAELLADPLRAGNALQRIAEPAPPLIGQDWVQNLLRAAPVLGAGR